MYYIDYKCFLFLSVKYGLGKYKDMKTQAMIKSLHMRSLLEWMQKN
jgi:hypothetical protein